MGGWSINFGMAAPFAAFSMAAEAASYSARYRSKACWSVPAPYFSLSRATSAATRSSRSLASRSASAGSGLAASTNGVTPAIFHFGR